MRFSFIIKREIIEQYYLTNNALICINNALILLLNLK